MGFGELKRCIAFGLFSVVFLTSLAHGAEGGKDRVQQPEEEDFQTSPYGEYGAFNEDKEEEEETKFFQHGRLFGVSAGGGMSFVSGNRGAAWQGGLPLIDLRLHYWFDFHIAADFQFTTVPHSYPDLQPGNSGRVNATLIRMGGDLKYYVDIKDLSAAITFANPYFLIGVGAYTKTESNPTVNVGNVVPETAIGITGGLGFEFTLKPRKIFLNLEGRTHFVAFADTYSSSVAPLFGVDDFSGLFWSATLSLLLTW